MLGVRLGHYTLFKLTRQATFNLEQSGLVLFNLVSRTGRPLHRGQRTSRYLHSHFDPQLITFFTLEITIVERSEKSAILPVRVTFV